MWLIILIILLCGYWVAPVESQITVSRPIKHTLPPELESGLFGSPENGGCSSISGTNNKTCDGTSVLNDGILPTLSGVSNNSTSQWANKLFTMRRSGTDPMVVSVELPHVTHNHMELTVFNCPQLSIYAPQVIVYAADSLNANAINNLIMVANVTLPDVFCHCDYLWKFYVRFPGGVGIPNFNLVFPYQNNSDFVFLGEITFLNEFDNLQCRPPEQITMRIPLQTSTTDSTIVTISTSNATTNLNVEDTTTMLTVITNKDQCAVTAVTTGVISVITTAIIVAGIAIAIQISIHQCFYMPKLRPTLAATVTATDGDHKQMEAAGDDDVVYEVIDEMVGKTLEMKENEAYSIDERMGGLKLKENDAYGATRST